MGVERKEGNRSDSERGRDRILVEANPVEMGRRLVLCSRLSEDMGHLAESYARTESGPPHDER